MSDSIVEIFVLRVMSNCLEIPHIEYRIVNTLQGIHSTGETIYEFCDYSYCDRIDYNDELKYITDDIDAGAYDGIAGTQI